MKPGSRDKKYSIRIQGAELAALKARTLDMSESFGLDRRIERYQGMRPIGFWAWDLDCLMDLFDIEWDLCCNRSDKPKDWQAFLSLAVKIKALYDEAGRDRGG